MTTEYRSFSAKTMETASARRPSRRYSLAMRQGGRGRGSSRALAAAHRVVRWQPRSYVQVWAMAASGYVVCAVVFAAIVGWHRAGGPAFVSAAVIWSGAGAGQSYRLHRRRTA